MLQNYDKYLFKAFDKDKKNVKKYMEHYIKSYNNFLNIGIERIINELTPIEINEVRRERGKIIKKEKYVSVVIDFMNPFIEKPKTISSDIKENIDLYPNECRNLNKTYSVKISVNYILKIYIIENGVKKLKREEKSGKPLTICKFPCLVNSLYCNLYGKDEESLKLIREDRYEIGAYFILNGNERKIISHENKTQNMLYRNKLKDEYIIWIQSKKINTYKYPYFTTVVINKHDEIFVHVYISKYKNKNPRSIPLVIFYRAFGILTHREMWNMITGGNDEDLFYENILRKSFMFKKTDLDVNDIKTQKDALLYIAKKYRKSLYHKDDLNGNDEILSNINIFKNKFMNKEFLPHIGNKPNKIPKKMILLSYMIKTLILFKKGFIKEMNKNDYGNKRIKLCGNFCDQLFRHVFKLVKNDLITDISKIINTEKGVNTLKIERLYKTDKFTKTINKHMSVGDWPVGGSGNSKSTHAVLSGVTSNLDRKSPLGYTMENQKITSIVKSRGGKSETIPANRRMINNTQFLALDFHDTPENEKVGIVKYKTYTSTITLGSDPSIIYEKLDEMKNLVYKVEHIKYTTYANDFSIKIFINGDYAYCSDNKNMMKVYKELIKLKRKGEFDMYTSIVMESELFEIRIYTDEGRFMFPLYIVDKGNKLRITKDILEKLKKDEINWQWLLLNEIIEYISIHEAKYCSIIAIDKHHLETNKNIRFTHCMLTYKQVLSINTLSIPMANHMASPRVTFLNSMSKQGGAKCYVENHDIRLDTRGINLLNPQRSICTTLGQNLSLSKKLPSYLNAIVAIFSMDGNNIEDSIQVNRASFERGFGTLISIKTYQLKKDSDSDVFIKPDPKRTKNYKKYNSYDKIDKNGLPIIGSRIKKGDVIIGRIKHFTKTEIEKNNQIFEMVDKSKIYDGIDDGFISYVEKFTDESDTREIVKVKIIFFRKATNGDKFTSQSAQKSTIGEIINPEDMPFDEEGMTPDILFNLCALPKRMTMSQLMQGAIGLLGTHYMDFIDATTFNGINVREDLVKKLKNAGFKDSGERILRDGRTGQKIKTKIFMGPITYLRLKHMVLEKQYVRGTGTVDIETRQPGKGRNRGGGLRIGEMERDALIANGATGIIQHKFVDHSNKYHRYISGETNFPCIGNKNKNLYIDGLNDTKISKVNIPWITNYVYHLFTSLGISLRFYLDDNIRKIKKNRVSNPILTRYEIPQIISFRVSQLNNGFKPLVKFRKFDPWEIAERELREGKLQYTIERKMPYGEVELWKLNELKYIDY
jgi:DNA-directed RNA polymerase beta subunit